MSFTSDPEELIGAVTFACRFTLSGSLARALARIETSFGSLSRTTIGECTGGSLGSISVLQGSLSVTSWLEPEARGACNVVAPPSSANAGSLCAVRVKLGATTLNLEVFGGAVSCVYRGDVSLQAPLTSTGRSGQEYTFGLFAILSSSRLPKTSGNIFCPNVVTASGGLGALSPAQTFTVLA